MNTQSVGSEIGGESKFEYWRSRISTAYDKTVESIVNVGNLFKQAKEVLGASYKQLEEILPFSASMATNFIKIAEHPVLSDSAYWKNLPIALTTLYYLSMLDAAKVIAHIESGKITPDLTLAQAKALVRPMPDAANDGDAGEQKTTDGNGYVPVVMMIPKPKPENVGKFLEDAEKFTKKYQGTLEDPKNRGSIGGWRREIALEAVSKDIAGSEGKLQNTTIDEVRMVERGSNYLSKTRKVAQAGDGQVQAGKANDLQLPDDYEDYAALTLLLGETVITKKVIKKWCKANDVPTQLTLSDVKHEVYVWEQLRLVAAREDEKGARKRLAKMAASKKDFAIAGAAQEALKRIAHFDV